jgi:16S rRNA (cytosine1402-N4)-methyltransferase
MDFHVPVMVREVVQGLVADPGGVYLDVTVGGGGHSRAILQALSPSGRLIAVDRDGEAVEVARRMFGENPRQVEFLRGSFVELKQLLKQCQVEAAHGILFDLGVSSHQIDEPSRGFSYREEGPLDMRITSCTRQSQLTF